MPEYIIHAEEIFFQEYRVEADDADEAMRMYRDHNPSIKCMGSELDKGLFYSKESEYYVVFPADSDSEEEQQEFDYG